MENTIKDGTATFVERKEANKSTVDKLTSDVDVLKIDADARKTDVNALKTDVNALKTDVNALKIIETGADYVVASGRSSDNTKWYRQWKSGWLEQGGTLPANTNWANSTISFLKTFKDISYTYVQGGIAYSAWTTNGDWSCPTGNKTTSSISVRHYSNVSFGTSWYACGQGAD